MNLEDLIAPCGINCRLCMAYGREKRACPGCRGDDAAKAKSCLTCRMKNCEKLVKGGFEYCFECDTFPCERVIHLDIRYRTTYAASPIDNLVYIRNNGIMKFVDTENERWACPECGAILCMHRPQCLSCGYTWRQ